MGGRGRSGRGARLGIGAQVTLTVLLAAVAVVMLNWLAGRPGLRRRWDLTEKGQNTLGTATQGVLGRLQAPVTVDVFYRRMPGPLSALADQAMRRTYRLLMLMSTEAGQAFKVRNNDTSDKAAYDERAQELRLTGYENCLVVHQDGRRAVVRLRDQLATFDGGNPDPDNFRPPRMVSFDAEEAIVQGILKVTQGDERPQLYFSTGHGEREILGTGEPGDLGSLHTALIDDGFDVSHWNHLEDGPLPDDCAALAIIGPETPLSDAELDAIEAWVDGGGRLVVSSHTDAAALDRSRLPELLERYGVQVGSGIASQPFIDPFTGRPSIGAHQVADYLVGPENMARHPITVPLRQDRRTVRVRMAHPVTKSRQPDKGTGVTDWLFKSTPDSWVDAQPLDWRPDQVTESMGRPVDLAVTSLFVPYGKETVGALEARDEVRIVAIGSTDFFADELYPYNADFLRNLFNWLTDREYRVAVSARDPDERRLPDELRPGVSALALWLLPGLSLVCGVLMAVVRARGGPRRRPGRSAA